MAAAGTLLAPLLSGCWVGAGGSGSGGDSVNVLMVNNPQMVELQKLTASHFTKETGIKVNFTVLPENDVRDKISQDFANQAGQYDVATLSNYEIPIYARNGWLHEMNSYVAKDASYDEKDVLKPMRQSLTGDDGKLYGQPFYGESSFLMYRKDVFAAKGLKMPAHPTWDQVADLAAKADGAKPGMKGICLRGLPGWGENLAPLDTVVNTFGGRWYDTRWNAKLEAQPFRDAVGFYIDTLQKYGEPGAAASGFSECVTRYSQGQAAMWYDATSMVSTVESKTDSKVVGKSGYAAAPVVKTKHSGWLYTWSLGIPKSAKNKQGAWQFMSWVTSKKYIELVGHRLGWARVPPGSRLSTYRIPQYKKIARAYAKPTLDALRFADPAHPTVKPVPYTGIQFVGIPEFQDLGTRVSQQISAAIAGQSSVGHALQQSQQYAQVVGDSYKQAGKTDGGGS
jgi:sorbitol/mannitol transport system substrate-binding protein